MTLILKKYLLTDLEGNPKVCFGCFRRKLVFISSYAISTAVFSIRPERLSHKHINHLRADKLTDKFAPEEKACT